MTLNKTPDFIGWFNQDGNVGSVQAAVSNGTVARHFEAGFVQIHNRGKLSTSEAIAQGLMDKAAVDFVAGLESCTGRPPGIYTAPVQLEPADRFDGSPIGDLVAALQTWSRNPMAQENSLALCEALEAFEHRTAAE